MTRKNQSSPIQFIRPPFKQLTFFKNPFLFSPLEESVVDCRCMTLMSPFSLAGIKSTNFPLGIKDLDLGICTRGTVATRVVDGTNANKEAGLNKPSTKEARRVLVFIMVGWKFVRALLSSLMDGSNEIF